MFFLDRPLMGEPVELKRESIFLASTQNLSRFLLSQE